MSNSTRNIALALTLSAIAGACSFGTWRVVTDNPYPVAYTSLAATRDGSLVFALSLGGVYAHDQATGDLVATNIETWHFGDAVALTNAPSHPDTAWSLHTHQINRWGFDNAWPDALFLDEEIALPTDFDLDEVYDLSVDLDGDIYLTAGVVLQWYGYDFFHTLLYRHDAVTGTWDSPTFVSPNVAAPHEARISADPAGEGLYLLIDGHIYEVDGDTLSIAQELPADPTTHVGSYVDIDVLGGVVLAGGQDAGSRGLKGAVALYDGADGGEYTFATGFGWPLYGVHLVDDPAGDVHAWLSSLTTYSGQISTAPITF